MTTPTGAVESDLYELSRMLGSRRPDHQSHGVLGGEWGYGNEYSNDVFEMHPFWWGDCECGFDTREAQFEEDCPHLDDCYQVRWYKYIGRNTELNRDVSWAEWRAIVDACVASIKEAS